MGIFKSYYKGYRSLRRTICTVENKCFDDLNMSQKHFRAGSLRVAVSKFLTQLCEYCAFTMACTTLLCLKLKSLDTCGQWMWQLYSHRSSSFERKCI